jgi:hypothetical protein
VGFGVFVVCFWVGLVVWWWWVVLVNPSRSSTLVIVPPAPESTNEGNILGHSPRQLGIGMVEIKVVNAEG